MIKKSWQNAGGNLFLRDVSEEFHTLDKGIYTINPSLMGLYLNKMAEEFTFDFKIYGLERELIDMTKRTYLETNGNLGILMNGLKGTGKTITSKILSNELSMPVLLVGANYPGLVQLLAEIPQDITVLIDEYEKIFPGTLGTTTEYDNNIDEEVEKVKGEGDSTLLGLMDGTYKTEYRRLFLLTTNKRWINENMINRPGRLRYIKNFGDLEISAINEILDDCLVEKQFKEDILEFCKPLQIITVDIVKAIISQVNIFKTAPIECCKFLNVEKKEEEFKIYKITGTSKKKETVLDEYPHIGITQKVLASRNNWVGQFLYINNTHYYLIKDGNQDFDNNVFEVARRYDNKTAEMTIKIKKERPIHKSFVF